LVTKLEVTVTLVAVAVVFPATVRVPDTVEVLN
jgi:hypothetical protein